MAFGKGSESNSSDNSKAITELNNENDLSRNDFDEFFSNINALGNNVSSITKKAIALTHDSVNDLNDQLKNKSLTWLFNLDEQQGLNDDKDIENFNGIPDEFKELRQRFKYIINDLKPSLNDFFSKPYEDHEKSSTQYNKSFGPFDFSMNYNNSFGPSDILTWRNGNNMLNFFEGSIKSGKTPFGYYSQKVPATRYYNDCLNKDGKSIWDSKGYWRCLFPNSEIPNEFLSYKKQYLPNEILTKEDFNDAERNGKSDIDGVIDLGSKGIFFNGFDVYLNWKNIMYENIKNEKLQRRNRLLEQRKQTSEQLNDQRQPHHQQEQQPQALLQNVDSSREVVSSSIQTTYKSDDHEVTLNEIRTEFYKDGTSMTKNIIKSKPIGADDWVNVNEKVEQGNQNFDVKGEPSSLNIELIDDSNSVSNEAAKLGWFWNNKD